MRSTVMAVVVLALLGSLVMVSVCSEAVPPTAVLQSATEVADIDQLVNFTGEHSTDPDGGHIDEWFFDWGDGSNTGWLTTPLANHSWDAEGEYEVSLHIKDDDAEQNAEPATLTITISDIPALYVGDTNLTMEGTVMQVILPLTLDAPANLTIMPSSSASNSLFGREFDFVVMKGSGGIYNQEIANRPGVVGGQTVQLTAGEYQIILVYVIEVGEAGNGKFTFTAMNADGYGAQLDVDFDYEQGDIPADSDVWLKLVLIVVLVLAVILLGLFSLKQ